MGKLGVRKENQYILKLHTPVGSLWRQFSFGPARLLKWQQWMVRDNPQLHTDTHTEQQQQGWAASGSGCGHPWISLSARAHSTENLTGQQWCLPRRLNPWLLVVQGTGKCGQCDIHLHAGVRVYCSGPVDAERRNLGEKDVEPIYEWQRQESWAGIQLHGQAAGRHGIYVHHSG